MDYLLGDRGRVTGHTDRLLYPHDSYTPRLDRDLLMRVVSVPLPPLLTAPPVPLLGAVSLPEVVQG